MHFPCGILPQHGVRQRNFTRVFDHDQKSPDHRCGATPCRAANCRMWRFAA
jgi:hypothetical protein